MLLNPCPRSYKADRTKLLTLMEFACLPQVGKVPTFGHQYAFARCARRLLPLSHFPIYTSGGR
jgi:hypothetical protein